MAAVEAAAAVVEAANHNKCSIAFGSDCDFVALQQSFISVDPTLSLAAFIDAEKTRINCRRETALSVDKIFPGLEQREMSDRLLKQYGSLFRL